MTGCLFPNLKCLNWEIVSHPVINLILYTQSKINNFLKERRFYLCFIFQPDGWCL